MDQEHIGCVDENVEMVDEESSVKYVNHMANLSDIVLLNIFQYLPAKELLTARVVCKQWYCLGRDEPLWKKRFYIDFKIDPSRNMAPGGTSWFDEYKRLYCKSPVVQTEELVQHTDQVLHVNFSHDGNLFCTCSKDSHILVWGSSYPVSIKYENSKATQNWNYSQTSVFNKSDTLLLVSGVYSPDDDDSTLLGELAIFAVQDGLPLVAKIEVSPYDIFGDWYDDSWIFHGDVKVSPDTTIHSFIYSNQILGNVFVQDNEKLIFHFTNENGAAVRYIILAKNLSSSPLENENTDSDNTDTNESASVSNNNNNNADFKEGDILHDDDVCKRLFICTVGTKTYIPHQIGFKKIPHSKLERKSKRSSSSDYSTSDEDTDSDSDSGFNVHDEPYDTFDHLIDMSGHIIGMKLSPDHKYLFVNCRPWPENFIITDPFKPPSMNEDIQIHVIDLCTLEEVPTTFSAHKGYTPTDDCFFISLDVSEDYVASGSEDNCGYLWERHYGNCIAKLPHTEVVNAVAFNPSDPEMLVTVSDDYSIKVWRSRSKAKEIGLNMGTMQLATGV